MNKKIIKSLITVLFAATCMLTFNIDAEAESIAINEVDNVLDTTSQFTTYHFDVGEVSKIFDLKLTKPAYVRMEIESYVGSTYTTKGCIVKSGIYENNSIINQDGAGEPSIFNGQTSTRSAVLEEGSYQIKLLRADNADLQKYQGNIKIRINIQYINVIKAGTNKDNAIGCKNGNIKNSILSNKRRTQWYKIVMPASGTVTINYYYTNPISTEIDKCKHGVMIYNSDGESVKTYVNPNSYGSIYEINVTTDKRSTYYVCVYGDYTIKRGSLKENSGGAFGKTSVSVSWNINDNIAPKRPTVRKALASTRTLKGKAEAYSKVTVTYKGKKYKTNANANGYFKVILNSKMRVNDLIKIYCTDYSGNNSKRKNFLVKPHYLNKAKIISSVPGKRIIKGYTVKPQNTVILKIGKKQYKTKSNKLGYFKFKTSIKIYEETGAKIKVKDKYGNYSKWKKIKFPNK